ncbi:MAG: type II CAAX endopeptidase family protein [Nitriliruptorales bacterium]|nr:type II CAAX endopeptidase family protein [Nitriliruptorales bacterium]
MSDHLPPGRPPPPPPMAVPPPPPRPPTGSSSVDAGRWAVPFNAFDGLWLVIWTLLAQLVVGVVIAVALLATGNSSAFEDGGVLTRGAGLLGVAAIAQLVTLAGALGYLQVRKRLSGHLLGPGPHGWSKVALGVGAGIGCYLGVTVMVIVGSLVVDTGEPNQAALEASTDGPAAFLMAILVAGILAPILEEVVFRGVLFQSLRQKMGLWAAVALSSLAFTVVHIELLGAPIFLGGLFVLAGFLALLLHWTKSLVVPIVAHATFNTITLILAVVLPEVEV